MFFLYVRKVQAGFGWCFWDKQKITLQFFWQVCEEPSQYSAKIKFRTKIWLLHHFSSGFYAVGLGFQVSYFTIRNTLHGSRNLILENRQLWLHLCLCEPEPEDFPSVGIPSALHPQHRSLGYLLSGLDAATVDTTWDKPRYPTYSMSLLRSLVPLYSTSLLWCMCSIQNYVAFREEQCMTCPFKHKWPLA